MYQHNGIRTFFISDTHFYDRNMCKYDRRNFHNIDHMNQTMMMNWNRVVRPTDVVYHLGDVSFGSKNDTRDIIKSLNGHKILLLGDHDRVFPDRYWKECGFSKVHSMPILFRGHYLLSHEPVLKHKSRDLINICGHTHSYKADGRNGVKNVCVEAIDYTPITIQELLYRG